MSYRKLVKFGNSSYILSLPKAWIVKHNLDKGDLISVLEEDGYLRLEPGVSKKEDPIRELVINVDCDLPVWQKLISAYINNYDVINLVGKNISSKSEEIRELVGRLVALELVQQSPKKITLKSFLNIKGVSIPNLIRRMDLIIGSMMDDARECLRIGSSNKIIEQKETDINRLSYFMFKTLKKAMRSDNMRALKLTPQDILLAWEVVLFMEKVADEIKRIARYSVSDVRPILKTYDEVCGQYKASMKAYFGWSPEAAIRVKMRKKELFLLCESCLDDLSGDNKVLVEKLKSVNRFSSNIADCVLKFESC